MAFLQRRVLHRRIGDYLFVHAGLHPGRPLDDQTEHDMLWIREPFLSGHDWPHPVTVVHGHTPEGPTVLAHRIGVDSGVFASGCLTAVRSEEHTSELQSLMRISYAVFCLKYKNII